MVLWFKAVLVVDAKGVVLTAFDLAVSDVRHIGYDIMAKGRHEASHLAEQGNIEARRETSIGLEGRRGE